MKNTIKPWMCELLLNISPKHREVLWALAMGAVDCSRTSGWYLGEEDVSQEIYDLIGYGLIHHINRDLVLTDKGKEHL